MSFQFPGRLCFAVTILSLSLPHLTFAGQSQDANKANDKGKVSSTASENFSKDKDKGENATTSKVADPVEKGEAKYDKASYTIGIEDDLQISVWHEPELSGPVTVRPDGKITLPLLNDIPVVGLKTDELQSLLTDKLKAFVNEPQVTVIVRAIKSRKVYLYGATARQGSFSLNSQKTVLELLAEAGGLGQFAKSEAIYILRVEGGRQIRIPFSYKKALRGKSNDVALEPGDMVVVP